MMTIEHLRDAWTYALFEINAAILHLESGEGLEPGLPGENPKRAADAWLDTLHRDRRAYTALLMTYPAVH